MKSHKRPLAAIVLLTAIAFAAIPKPICLASPAPSTYQTIKEFVQESEVCDLGFGNNQCLQYSLSLVDDARGHNIPCGIVMGWYKNQFSGDQGLHCWNCFYDGKDVFCTEPQELRWVWKINKRKNYHPFVVINIPDLGR